MENGMNLSLTPFTPTCDFSLMQNNERKGPLKLLSVKSFKSIVSYLHIRTN